MKLFFNVICWSLDSLESTPMTKLIIFFFKKSSQENVCTLQNINLSSLLIWPFFYNFDIQTNEDLVTFVYRKFVRTFLQSVQVSIHTHTNFEYRLGCLPYQVELVTNIRIDITIHFMGVGISIHIISAWKRNNLMPPMTNKIYRNSME